MLTKLEAIEFLQNSWKMKNVEQQLHRDGEMFLNKLIITIEDKVPFQLLFCLKISQIPPELRKPPSFDKINEMCMSGHGGNCVIINTFTSNLLKALGYSAYLCRVTVTTKAINPHLVVIVKDLIKTGDLHLVDCGLGLPSFHAISLNFTKESPIFHDSFLEYKLVKYNGKILRMHGEGDLVPRDTPITDNDFVIGKWRRFFEFTIETLECETLDDLGPALSFRYLPPNPALAFQAARFPGKKAILLYSGFFLYIEQEDKTLKVIKLRSKNEVFKTFRDYFPTLNEDLVTQAYSKWHSNL